MKVAESQFGSSAACGNSAGRFRHENDNIQFMEFVSSSFSSDQQNGPVHVDIQSESRSNSLLMAAACPFLTPGASRHSWESVPGHRTRGPAEVKGPQLA